MSNHASFKEMQYASPTESNENDAENAGCHLVVVADNVVLYEPLPKPVSRRDHLRENYAENGQTEAELQRNHEHWRNRRHIDAKQCPGRTDFEHASNLSIDWPHGRERRHKVDQNRQCSENRTHNDLGCSAQPKNDQQNWIKYNLGDAVRN